MTDPLAAYAQEADDELKNVRLQLRAMQSRTSKKVDMLRDLQLFFTRQSEIEQNYGKQLESLYSKFSKPRSERSAVSNVAKALGRRNDDEGEAAVMDDDMSGRVDEVWAVLLNQVKKRAAARTRFATKLGEEMRSRFDALEKETQATSKKCLDLGHALHTDLQASFKHTEDTMRVYHTQQAKYIKARDAHSKALEKGQLKKGGKMKDKVAAAEKKATVARNEYILARIGANARKKRFYDTEVGRIFDMMDLYFHSSLRYTFTIFYDMVKQNQAIEKRCSETVNESAQSVSAATEKDQFMRDNTVYFMPRPAFEHITHRDDATDRVVCNPETLSELMQRYSDLGALASKSDLQIKREHETLKTILTLRLEKIGNTLQTNENGIYRSVENSEMLSDSYSRLVHSTIHFKSLASQITLLKDALGPNTPQGAPYFDGSEPDASDEDMHAELMSASEKCVTAEHLAQVGTFQRTGSQTSVENSPGMTTLIKGGDDLSPIRSRSGSMASTHSQGDADDKRRRPAPAPPGSPRLGRSKKRSKRPERPPDPKSRSSSGYNNGPTKANSPKRPDPVAKLRSGTISSQNPYRFGGDLQEIADVTHADVPMVVQSCIKSLHECGVDVEGIFRIPGSQSQVDELQRGFETGRDPLFRGTPDHIQPFAVAGLLKLYLRSLSEPVMTTAHYQDFIKISTIPGHSERLKALQKALYSHLPPAHLSLLSVLMPFLFEVSEHKDENKMGVPNLAVVFGPTLMPSPPEDPTAMVRDAAPINAIVSLMIEYHDWIFKSPSNGDASDSDFSDSELESQAASRKTSAAVIQNLPGSNAKAHAESGALKSHSADKKGSPDAHEAADPAKLSAPASKEEGSATQYVVALHNYSGRNASELSFKKGQRIEVHEKVDDNWWKGIIDGKKGYIASAYVKEVAAAEPKDGASEDAGGPRPKPRRASMDPKSLAAPVAAPRKPSPGLPRRMFPNSGDKESSAHPSKVGPASHASVADKPKPSVRPRTKTNEAAKQPPSVKRPPPPTVARQKNTLGAATTQLSGTVKDKAEDNDGDLDLDAVAEAEDDDMDVSVQDENDGYLAITDVQAHRLSTATPTLPPSFAVPPPPPPSDTPADHGAEKEAETKQQREENADRGVPGLRRQSTGGSRKLTVVRGSVSERSMGDFLSRSSVGDGAVMLPPITSTDATTVDDANDSNGDDDEDGGNATDFGESDDERANDDEPFFPPPLPPPGLDDDGDDDDAPAPPFDMTAAALRRDTMNSSTSGVSRHMSFGPTFAPPPPPPPATDNLPPPPPDGVHDDDEVFLGLPPPPAPTE